MKVVILAGGKGTRLQEETIVRPKPMVEIGGRPILWHIMELYSQFGFKEFVVALGYKGHIIKDYFVNYHYSRNSLGVDLATGKVDVYGGSREGWYVQLIDTGLSTETGGRIKTAARWAGKEPFMLTYGDGIANIDIRALLEFHRQHGKLATVTAVRPTARFGSLSIEENRVASFVEKPRTGDGWINGGFFVLQPEVVDYIKDDDVVFEREPLERLTADGQLAAYRHEDFWQCMDTMRDVHRLEELWKTGNAPWRDFSRLAHSLHSLGSKIPDFCEHIEGSPSLHFASRQSV